MRPQPPARRWRRVAGQRSKQLDSGSRASGDGEGGELGFRGNRFEVGARDCLRADGGGLIRMEAFARRFETIAPLLLRYPAIDPDAFRAKVERFIQGVDDARAR